MCCGEDAEVRATEGENENTARLARQLQDMEERLVATQEKLDDLQYERDTYKAKVCCFFNDFQIRIYYPLLLVQRDYSCVL